MSRRRLHRADGMRGRMRRWIGRTWPWPRTAAGDPAWSAPRPLLSGFVKLFWWRRRAAVLIFSRSLGPFRPDRAAYPVGVFVCDLCVWASELAPLLLCIFCIARATARLRFANL